MNSSVHALVADRTSGWAFATIPAPLPRPDQVLVAVSHVGLNHGDARYARIAAPGTVLGWDASGVVVQAAQDDRGPVAGTPVVAFGAGAWAELAAFAADDVAVLAVAADPGPAAALPTAGFSALRALRAAGTTLGRRVLVTGATGGVGTFAVQLAALGGAHVTASSGRPEQAERLRALGAHDVVATPDEVTEPVDIVIDTVGGPQLVSAFERLAPGGNLQSVGWSSGAPAVLAPYSTFAPAKSLSTFADADAVGADLAYLVGLMESGHLRVDVGWRGTWDRVDEAADALAARQVAGKAVLEVACSRAPSA